MQPTKVEAYLEWMHEQNGDNNSRAGQQYNSRDSRSTIMITIVPFTIAIAMDMIFELTFALYRPYFM